MHLSGVRLSVLSSRTPLLWAQWRFRAGAGWGAQPPPQIVASPPNLAILDTMVN